MIALNNSSTTNSITQTKNKIMNLIRTKQGNVSSHSPHQSSLFTWKVSNSEVTEQDTWSSTKHFIVCSAS